MIFHRYPADLGEALVNLQVSAIQGQAGEPNRRGVVNQSRGGLLRKQHYLGRLR